MNANVLIDEATSEQPLGAADHVRILAAMAKDAARAQEKVLTLQHELAVHKAVESEIAFQRNRADQAEAQLAMQSRRADEAEARYAEIIASTSWRITGPLRRLSDLLRRR